MELIFVIIIIAIAVSNAQNGKGGRDRSTQRKNRQSDVWEQVDKGASDLFKIFVGSTSREQITRGARDLQDAVNNIKRKTIQKAKQKEADSYQKEQSEWRKRQEEDRKRRDMEEQRKKKLELQKKEAEQRRKALEREKREREEKALLEHCQLEQDKGCDVHKDYGNGSSASSVTGFSERTDDGIAKKQSSQKEEPEYRVEEYLDPLTSSFYPDVEDYLFPTIAPFYPDIDVSSFSLQNQTDVI